MNLIYENTSEKSNIVLTDFSCADGRSYLKRKGYYKIIWARASDLKLLIDGCYTTLKKNHLIFCTPLNVITLFDAESSIVSFVFNREFYCILDNDDEVSCNGYLFYGSSSPVVIDLESKESLDIDDIFKNFKNEFDVKDSFQGEMLRTLLKRLLIKSNRLLDKKKFENEIDHSEKDVIRKFNILTEKHFKTHHKVSEYAALLLKSPKTIANVFSKYSETTPLMVINDRILLEARRLLLFSEQPVKQIAATLGYTYASHFSCFFKKNQGCSPVHFRKEFDAITKGKNL